MTDDNDLWAEVDKSRKRKKNRRQRRAEAFMYLPRAYRRNLHGRGRWRRRLSVTTGRYESPFADPNQ